MTTVSIGTHPEKPCSLNCGWGLFILFKYGKYTVQVYRFMIYLDM